MSKNFENELVLPTAGLEMNDSQMQDVEGGSADSIMVRGKVNALEQAVEAGALDGWSKSTFTSLDGTTRTSILGPIISFNSAESVGGGYGATVITHGPFFSISRCSSGNIISAEKNTCSRRRTNVWSYSNGTLTRY